MKRQDLPVRKTYKLFIGGQFVRSESGRYSTPVGSGFNSAENYCHASRKDFRDAMVAARGAVDGWGKKSAYLRGQILYRAAEMLQSRADEFSGLVSNAAHLPLRQARKEVQTAVDVLVHYAGWSDKYLSVFGSVNPVASSHFNFTVLEPVGVVALLAPADPLLLPAVCLVAAAAVSGNASILLLSEKNPIPGLVFAEVLATSDLPAGVVNILSAPHGDLLPHIAGHMDLDSVVDASNNPSAKQILQSGTGNNLKRYTSRSLKISDWFTPKVEDPYWILDTVEFKTAWHPIGF